jgi:hypothetical protein
MVLNIIICYSEYIYASLGKPKQEYNKLEQLGISFLGGYIAGVFCAIVSHPADTLVSKVILAVINRPICKQTIIIILSCVISLIM